MSDEFDSVVEHPFDDLAEHIRLDQRDEMRDLIGAVRLVELLHALHGACRVVRAFVRDVRGMMRGVAARMTEREIRAVAEYAAGLR